MFVKIKLWLALFEAGFLSEKTLSAKLAIAYGV